MSPEDVTSFGIFALVSYVPAPLGEFLDAMRRSLPSESYPPKAHITLVPPRPLHVSLETASSFAQEIVSGFGAFRVKLGGLHRFTETNFFYLDLERGQEKIHMLHDALNSGVLAHEERFEFRPHLTVGGPVPESDLHATYEQLSMAWSSRNGDREFQLSEVAALWFDPLNGTKDWKRVWTRRFGTSAITRASCASRNSA